MNPEITHAGNELYNTKLHELFSKGKPNIQAEQLNLPNVNF